MTRPWTMVVRLLPLVAAAMVFTPLADAQQKGPPPGKGPPAASAKADDKTPPGKDKAEEAKNKDGGAPAASASAKADEPKLQFTDSDREKGRKKAKEVVEGRKNLPKAKKDARDAEKQHVKDVAKKHGKSIPRAALKQEENRHARRMARLARLREVAEKANDTASVERIEKLTAHEVARHDKWMDGHATEPMGGQK